MTPAPGHPVAVDAGDITALGDVLGIWAHPDDETYLMGGVLALAAASGQRTACITATAGEHGTPDPARWPPHRLAVERRQELHRALGVLGVGDHVWLGLEDGRCDDFDHDLAVASLVDHIDRLAPDTVVSFGPDGITGHTDHRAVGRWVTDAVAACRTEVHLLQSAKATDWAVTFDPMHRELDVFEDGYPVPVPTGQLALDLVLDEDTLDRKVEALMAQRTQTAPVIEVFGFERWREWIRRESFVLGGRSPG